MEENKVNQADSKASEPKKEHHSPKGVLSVYKNEFDKIIWPSKDDLIKQTFTVIVTSLMVGAIIASMDYVFSFCYRLLISMVG